MSVNFPRREKPAAKVGPRLEISPLELKNWLEHEHGLSKLLTESEAWEPFAWKGNDLSAPLRALFAAERRGLLKRNNDRANNVSIYDVTADINVYLQSFGKAPVKEITVQKNLQTAAQYLRTAVGVSVVADSSTMTVRFVDKYETAESIEKYFKQMEPKLVNLNRQLDHARNCGYAISHVISGSASSVGEKILAACN